MTLTKSPLSCNATGLNFKDFPLAEMWHFLWSCQVLVSVSLVVFSYPMCLTDLKGANHTGSITVPLRRRPAVIPNIFYAIFQYLFGLAVTQMHSFGAELTGKQNCAVHSNYQCHYTENRGFQTELFV